MHSRLSESLLGIVHGLDGRVGVRFVGVLDEAKPTGPASLTVLDDNLRGGTQKIRFFFSFFSLFFFTANYVYGEEWRDKRLLQRYQTPRTWF